MLAGGLLNKEIFAQKIANGRSSLNILVEFFFSNTVEGLILFKKTPCVPSITA
jgi:hypothetical protein